jgi:four helix bundle protein
MAAIKSHEELVAWQLSSELEDRVYAFVEKPAAARDRDFCNDIRRSARSAPANLAEGFGRFRPRENAKCVRISLGELHETRNHLRHAFKRGYIDQKEFDEMVRLVKRAVGAAAKWHAYLMSCSPDGPPSAKSARQREP